ncbi:MAG TPA: aldehyde dehydrogenase family protein [Acidimicrobiales bacterium]|nr:aldehyde dehydrogenase family protein [Acidimicrobiales bacterium]
MGHPELADAKRLSGVLVDGRWLEDGPESPVLDKYWRRPVATVACASAEHVDAALDAAWRVAEGEPLPPRRRAEVLEAAAGLLASRAEEVVGRYVDETGFTVRDAETELARTREILRLCAEEARRIAGEVVPIAGAPGGEGRLSFTLRVPVGVVVAISPFNAPLSTVAHKVGPALAAGNAVVLKPASATPLSAIHLCRALCDAGLPPGHLGLVCGPGSIVGERLVPDRRVRYFSFTGSTRVGLLVKQRSGIAKTQLELGANSATIVCADADLDLAAQLVVRGGYRKAGQVCTSVQRVLVEEAVARDLEDELARRVKALRVGDPHLEGTDVGPMIAEEEAARALGWVDEAVAAGARLLAGGTRSGPVLEPTLLGDVPLECRIMRDEIFAPVVALHRVADLDEAISVANATAYGLQAGVFTRSLDGALRAVRALRVGGVLVNDTSSYHADLMPYGGVKDSGYGLEGPRYAVADMTDTRTVVIRAS